MKKLRPILFNVILIGVLLFVFSQQAVRLTGDSHRAGEIGYLKGYEDGRVSMKKEFEDRMDAIKNARKMSKAGYEIDN